ncbi:fungal hydrophobin [Hymenopellis radicata]|nr:fungal hydrophobin [Hymenopellis radicata]
MQFKFVTLTTLALATFAAATPTPAPRQDGQCSTGELQCCNTTTTATDPLVSVILALLGIVLPDITAIIGINCSPLSVIGVGGSACQANPVCCQDNSVGGLISIGCLPVNL